jgi:uncharacterized protein YqhQ
MPQNKTFYYGGQAVYEGVMMRGRKSLAVAVRQQNGEIKVKQESLPSIYKGKLRETPIIRGVIVLIETMVLGVQTLFYSAQAASAETEEEQISAGTLWLTAGIALVFAVGIFFVGPLLLTNYLIYPLVSSVLLGNLIEGVLRIGIFVLYLWLINFMPDIRMVFAYHGAEHKTVNAYEHGVPLEVESVKKYSTAHARCGTSFLLIVLVIAIIVFSLLGRPALWISVLSRIVLLPVVAAFGYEVVRFFAGHVNNKIVSILLVPGLALQSLTTREPDDKKLEVAIAALKDVVAVDAAESVVVQQVIPEASPSQA